MLLVITSPENHKSLEEIRKQHLQLADPAASKSVKLNDLPAVIWMGYGVHGNEPERQQRRPAGRLPPRGRHRRGARDSCCATRSCCSTRA